MNPPPMTVNPPPAQDISILVPTLDALAALCLEEGLRARAAAFVLDKLHAASAEDLPSTVRFLLQAATPATAKETVRELRQSLNFISG